MRLTGGYTINYAAWLAVYPDDLRRAWEVWWTPAHADLRLAGILANKLPAWEAETYGKPLVAAVGIPTPRPTRLTAMTPSCDACSAMSGRTR